MTGRNPWDEPIYEVDCPGFIRLEPCENCGELGLTDEPPVCHGCETATNPERVESCSNTAVRGSEEVCGDCGYPAPELEEYDPDDYDPLEDY
jgi:hypothetical protein